MLRPCLPRIGASLRKSRRSLHSIPPLGKDFSKGIPGLYSPEGFDLAWTQYQGRMLDKLNSIVSGTEEERKTLKDILINSARNPEKASLFNHASMAHNNHFYFKGLHTDPAPMPEGLKDALEESFSSIDTLREEMINTANAMFGPGFVWLVKTANPQRPYNLLTTYLAGSPYPGAHYRAQPVDLNTEDTSISEHHRKLIREEPVNSVGAHGPHAETTRIMPGGIDLIPLLCINTWQHAWIADWGIGRPNILAEDGSVVKAGSAGKEGFTQNWWNKIDWDVVHDLAGNVPRKLKS